MACQCGTNETDCNGILKKYDEPGKIQFWVHEGVQNSANSANILFYLITSSFDVYLRYTGACSSSMFVNL